MLNVKGVALALCAAGLHSGVDWSRKAAHAKCGLSSTALVTLIAIIDSVVGSLGVYFGGGLNDLIFLDFRRFVIIVCCSSSLLLLTKILYQFAISTSPLSLTVPYLALTPMFLVGTAYFLVNEKPTLIGLAGVGIVTLGGYLLSRVGTGPDAGDVPLLSPDCDGHVLAKDDEERMGTRQDEASMSYQQSTALGGKATRRGGNSSSGSLDKIAGSSGRGCWDRIAQLPRQQKLSGSFMMLCVAGLFSITSSLDKLGVLYGSLWVYFASQRVIIGVACALYLLKEAPETFRLLRSHFWILLGISLCEIISVLVFLEAIKWLFVSYAVAIKRSNVLMSVLVGGLVFRENITRRLPYIILMLVGMVCIILDPKN